MAFVGLQGDFCVRNRMFLVVFGVRMACFWSIPGAFRAVSAGLVGRDVGASDPGVGEQWSADAESGGGREDGPVGGVEGGAEEENGGDSSGDLGEVCGFFGTKGAVQEGRCGFRGELAVA